MNKNTGNCDNKKNIKLILAYDGSSYAGWQRLGSLTGKPSVQSVVEQSLSAYLDEDIKVIGSGRTDAGVHALGQTANFLCYSCRSPADIKTAVNAILPEDIKILHAQEADQSFHSRYSARAKTYEYRIAQGEVQSVFTRRYMYHVTEYLDLSAMEKAAGFFLGTHDFKAFSTDRKDGKSTVRTIEAVKIRTYRNTAGRNPCFEVRISITGDGFLYNMVRIIIGTLIEIGKGTRQPEEILRIFETRDRGAAGVTVSSQGLFLMEVRY